jgi:hypothetical protein
MNTIAGTLALVLSNSGCTRISDSPLTPPNQLGDGHLVVLDVQLPNDGPCKVHLPVPQRTPEEHAAWRLDPQVQEQLRAQEGVLDQLVQLLQEGGDPPKV